MQEGLKDFELVFLQCLEGVLLDLRLPALLCVKPLLEGFLSFCDNLVKLANLCLDFLQEGGAPEINMLNF